MIYGRTNPADYAATLRQAAFAETRATQVSHLPRTDDDDVHTDIDAIVDAVTTTDESSPSQNDDSAGDASPASPPPAGAAATPPATSPAAATTPVSRARLTETDLARSIVVQQPNPKRAGSKSHARYEAYRAADSVREYLQLGGRRADLQYDVDHGYVAYTST